MVAWNDGVLYGQDIDIEIIKRILEPYEAYKIYLSPTGPVSTGDHLKNPLAFLVLCQQVFYSLKVKGEIPVLPYHKNAMM
jgi:hypothetical protein